MRKEKKNRKAKRKKKKQEERKTIHREKQRKMRKEEREREDFPTFGRSKFDSSRTKVGARSWIYVWTLRSWSFDKL